MSPIARTALRIGIPVLLLAAIVAFYLRANFSSRSGLFLAVPADAEWVYQFRTRNILKDVEQQPMPWLDSLNQRVKKLPLFAGVKDPRDLGLDLYSDLLVFRTRDGLHAAVQMNDENEFRSYLKTIQGKGVSGVIEKETYSYVHSTAQPLFLAFRNKLVTGFIPFTDSGVAYDFRKAEQVFTHLFDPDKARIGTDTNYQSWQKGTPHISYWKNKNFAGKLPATRVYLKDGIAKVQYLGDEQNKISPLLLFHHASAGKFDGAAQTALLDAQNRLSDIEYLNLTLSVVYEHLQLLTK
jgi:hypothetical protein